MIIRFKNWEKYNTRKDVKRPTWFAFKHDFFFSTNYAELGIEGTVAFLFLLSEASKSPNRGVVHVSHQQFHRCTGLCKTVLDSTVQILKRLHVVETRTLRGRYVDVTPAYATLQYNTEQDITVEAAPPVTAAGFDSKLSPQGKELVRRIGAIAMDSLRYEFSLKGGDTTLAPKLNELATYLAVNPEKQIKNLASWVNNCLRRSGQAPPPDDAPKEEPGKISSASKRILEEIANERK